MLMKIKSYLFLIKFGVHISYMLCARTYSPTRVAFFVWSPALGKILTHDNLCKRNVIVIEWCCLCKKSAKSPRIFGATFLFYLG